MRFLIFTTRRVLFALPQIFLITLVTFFIIRLLPGNPATILAGSYANPETIANIEHELGLDKSIWEQYRIYLANLSHGDLGSSWFSSAEVSTELRTRVPATLELITLSLLGVVLIGVGVGTLLGMGSGWLQRRTVSVYGQMAGSFPDFYLALVLVFIFFFYLGWAPSPFGRLGPDSTPPPDHTGFYTVDAILAGQWHTLTDALSHLLLPVVTLTLVYAAPVMKLSAALMEELLESEYCRYARACGLPRRVVVRYALRNSLPPVVTLIGFTYGFLLGGAVLVETVFSWGGVGQYVVDSVKRGDYFPVQAVVLLAAIFNLVVYLAVDVVHFVLDPRLET